MSDPTKCRTQRRHLLAGALGMMLLAGCGERARLIFDPGTSGAGPHTVIDAPETGLIRVPAGPMATVAGRAIDDDGVDTLYVLVVGGEQFRPFTPEEPTDTLRFILPISTTGHKGDTLTVLVFATDRVGVRGDTAARTLIVE
jgi:hypothetical protein